MASQVHTYRHTYAHTYVYTNAPQGVDVLLWDGFRVRTEQHCGGYDRELEIGVNLVTVTQSSRR